MKRKEKMGLIKRVLSIMLVLALVLTSVQIYVPAKDVQAASAEGMGDSENLSSTHVADSNVLAFFKILANAQKNWEDAVAKEEDDDITAAKNVLDELGTMTAGDIVKKYGSQSAYTKDVYGIYLTNYANKIDFEDLDVKNIEGIGWAKAATEFDLSSIEGVTEIPNSEFESCKMTKIVLPSDVTKIGDNAFKACAKLTTLNIGSGSENVVDLKKVTAIGSSAFNGCEGITQIDFSEYNAAKTELKIGSYAFASCKSISEIVIPIKTAENLGANAFEQCGNLATVGLHDELSNLSNGLFQGTGTSAPEGKVTFYVIGEENSDGVSYLPKNITYIGKGCFQDAHLGTMNLADCDKLETLEENSFASTRITELTLPNSLKTIESRAFQGSGINDLVIPDNCSKIGTKAFVNSGLWSVTLPKSLTRIEDETFKECKILLGSQITIPSDAKLEEIGKSAFADCEFLGTTAFLENQKNLTTIEDSAFADCYYYKTNNLSPVKDAYGENLLIGGLQEVVLPDCVVSLGESVFANNYNLRTVDLGTGVKEIPNKAFYNESSLASGRLETVIVSDELRSIGTSAFENQIRLHTMGYSDGSTKKVEEGTLQFGDNLLSIGDRAFAGCAVKNKISLTGVKAYALKSDVLTEAGEGLTEMLIYDYMDETATQENSYCRTVYVDESKLLVNLPDGVLDENNEIVNDDYMELDIVAKKVYLDESALNEEKVANGDQAIILYDTTFETDTEAYKNRFWSERNSIAKTMYCSETALDTAASITSGSGKTGYYVQPVTNSQIPNVSVAKGTSQGIALYYMFGIRNVKLPDSLKGDNLGASAFTNCINLKKVILPDALTEIKAGTFSGAGGEVDNSLNGGKKYYDYYGLQTVYIPKGLKVIGNNAFQNCHNLSFDQKNSSSSVLGTSLEKIGDSAFNKCYTLDTMKFPTSLTTIGSNAFAECAVKNTGDADYKFETSETIGTTVTKYTYYYNYEKYGTKTEKKGLYELDFKSAQNLESIGSAAFKQTNVQEIGLTNSPLEKIPGNLFEQCSYLRSALFPDNITSVGSDVFKDTPSLSGVTVPVTSTLAETFVSGAFGEVSVNRETKEENVDPVLTFSYKENDEVVVPINSEIRLPINAFDSKVSDGTFKVSIVEGNTETDIKNVSAKGLRAEIDMSTTPFSFILHGEEYLKEPVTVKIEAGTAFKYANFTKGSWISNHTFTYQVTVDDVPTESVTLSAAEDNNVKNNAAMYKESANRKNLYIAEKSSAATNGVKLTATINPAETTDEVTWESSDSNIVEVVPDTYTRGDGKATATIKLKAIGDATVTVKSGTKTDVIYVTGQVKVPAGGISCTTQGTILDSNLKNNSTYNVTVGDSDKINISTNFGSNTGYTDEQLNVYGESTVITSSDENVVVVEEDGTFRAVGTGTAVITVKGQASGEKIQFTLTVTDDDNYTPYSVTISGPSEVAIGSTIALSAVVAPAKASQEVTWAVQSGSQYASVDAQGNVTGIAKGDATIIATSVAKNTIKSAAFKVKVTAPIQEIKMLSQNVTVEVGKSTTISKTNKADDTKGFYVSPTTTTDTMTWTSSNEGVVSITKGDLNSVTFKGVATGTAMIIGTASSGVSVSFPVSVIQKTNSITMDKAVTLNVGKTHKLNPQKVPATSNENLTYTYTSSNPKIATVDANGVIRAIAPGAASITARTDTNKTAICNVTVKQPATKITLLLNRPSTKTIYVAKGQTVTISTKLAPENTTDKLTYKSNKPKIATVTPAGLITAKKKGTAKITIKADSGKKVTLKVVVSKKQVKAKKVKIKGPKSVKRKKTVKISVALTSKKSTDTLTFAVNKPNLATIDAYGNLTAKKKGKVKVTVTASSGKKATKTIKIK